MVFLRSERKDGFFVANNVFTLDGSPLGSGYISTFLFSFVTRFVKSLMKSEASFPASTVANSLLEAQKYDWAMRDEDDKSHNSSCSITCPLIWFRVNLEFTLTIKSLKIGNLGFPRRVHLIFSTLVDNITICCTLCRSNKHTTGDWVLFFVGNRHKHSWNVWKLTTVGFSSASVAHNCLLYLSLPVKLLTGSYEARVGKRWAKYTT